MDQTTNKSKKQYVFEEDQNNLNNNESQIKTAIFGVLFTLLRDQGISIYTACILVIIQFIQTVAFCFNSGLTSPMWDQSDVTDVLEDILGYFSFVYYFKQTNWEVYVAVLYICIAVLAFIGLDIVYVNFAFARRKITFSWPATILKNALLLFTTILFVPFTQYFISILDCVKDKQGNSVQTYFTEVQCWTGAHILHTIFAIFALILFTAISLVASLTLFEYKNDSNNPSARITSRPNFYLNLYQLVAVICLNFFSGLELEIIILAIILTGSTIVFVKFHFECPYHDEVMTKAWSLVTALNLWAALMLTFAKIMERTLFEGSVVAFLIGIPFVAYIIILNRDHRINLLLVNTNKFKNQYEVINQIRYVLKLIQWQGAKRNAGVLLNGYIEIHKKSCNRDDCPLKQKMAKNNRFAKSLMTKDENISEKHALFIQLLYKTYADAVAKFPKSVALRISYAFFLLEKMHSRQQALQELMAAEMNKPTLDEEFLIFRYKKIIEDEIAESKNENQNGLDLVTESTFQNHLRLIQANIEKATLLYMEFWSQLSEETPDLAKLNDIGSKISASVQTVEDNWVKLLKVNANNANALKLYGKFLLEIINDKEGGEDLLEKSRKLTTTQTNKKGNILDEENNHDATPTVYMSGEQESIGVITSLNLAAASLFGYSKNELANKKIDVLMPSVYSQFHDQFIENYLNGGDSSLINKNKERLVFGKHKTEYMFPVHLSVKAVQSIIQGIQFIGTFRVEKNFKSIAYVLTTPEGVIDGITPSCINILKFDQRVINTKKTNIENFIPHIVSHRAHLFTNPNNARKTTATINYTYPKEFELINDGDGSSTILNCQLQELNFLGGKENGGFQFRFERVIERQEKGGDEEGSSKQARISNFMFRHDLEQPRVAFVGEYIPNETFKQQESGLNGYDDGLLGDPNDQDSSLMRNSMRSVSDVWKVKVPPKEEEVEVVQEVKRRDYGYGIKTYKLFNGKPQDIEDNKSDENEDSEENTSNGGAGGDSSKQSSSHARKKADEQQAAYKEEDTQDEGMGDFNNTFKSRKQLKAIVNDRAPPTTIKNINRVANLLCLALAVISIVDYVIAVSDFNTIKSKINLLDNSNQNIAELMNVLARARDAYLYDIGLTGFSSFTRAQTISSMQDSLTASKTLTETLQEETGGLSSGHQSILDGQNIPMLEYTGTTTYKGLIQATQEILTRGFSLVNNANITITNPDFFYLTYNLLNDFFISMKSSSMYYSQELNDKVNSQTNSFMILLIASILTLIFGLALIFLILYQINKSREEVLSLFLDIPEKTVKSLFGKCEGFITNLQLGDEEELFSQFDDEELDRSQLDTTNNSNFHEFIPRKKRKHFKNSGRSQKAFFFKVFFVAAVVEAYFIYIFVSIDQQLSKIERKMVEFNSTSYAYPFYSFSSNSLRSQILNETFPILDQSSLIVNPLNNKAMYDLDSYILLLHANNRNIHKNDYADVFNQIMMVNPCEYVTEVSSTVCNAFAIQAVAQGLSVASTKYFEHGRVLARCYGRIVSGLACAINLITTVNLAAFDATQNLKFGLLLTTEGQEQSDLQYIYLKQSYRALIDAYKTSLSDEFSSNLTIRLVVFILFLVLVGAIYVFLWLPLVRKISTDIWRTKSMLSMIPLNVISKIKSVKIFLKKFWNERGSAEY